VARIPGMETAVGLVQAQADALAALPAVMASLTAAARGLGDVVGQARETLTVVNRLAQRMEALTDELEEPLRALAPGLERLAVVLEDPVVQQVPETLRRVQADVLPVLRTLADTHEKVAFIAGSTERIMTFVDDTSRTLAHLPGAALLGRRRTGSPIVMAPAPQPPAASPRRPPPPASQE